MEEAPGGNRRQELLAISTSRRAATEIKCTSILSLKVDDIGESSI